MTTAEERMKILDMIKDGKIKPDEGARLLQALQVGAEKSGDQHPAQWLRVRVTDSNSGKTKVNVNIPMGLVNVGLKMGARFVPKDTNFDYASVMDAIRSGTVGKIVDIEDAGEGERVEIWIE